MLFAGERGCTGSGVARICTRGQRGSYRDWSIRRMQASRQPKTVSLRIAGDGIADGGIRGVGNRPHHIGEIRLRVGAVAGRSLSSKGHELL